MRLCLAVDAPRRVRALDAAMDAPSWTSCGSAGAVAGRAAAGSLLASPADARTFSGKSTEHSLTDPIAAADGSQVRVSIMQRSPDSDSPEEVQESMMASLNNMFQAGKFVIDPHSSRFLPCWDVGIMLPLIIVVSLVVPYQVGFCLFETLDQGNTEKWNPALIFSIFVDAAFVSDIMLQFFIMFQHPENHRWVRMPVTIVRHYMRSWFFMDIVSVLPYDEVAKVLISYDLGEIFRFVGVFKVLGLLRLLRVNRLMTRYQNRFDMPYALLRLAKLLTILLLTTHFFACFWGFMLTIERFREDDVTWAEALRAAKPGLFQDSRKESSWELYTASMYWACMTITSIGYGDVVAATPLEAWCATCLMAASGLVWAYIIGSMCAIASSLDAQNVAYENQMDSLNNMMRTISLPRELRVQLREFFQCRKALFYREKQVELIRSMSPELQGKVARWVQQNMMAKVWFLREASSDGFVVGLFELFAFAVYPPRELVKLSNSLVCLRLGVVLRHAEIITPGSVWGSKDLLLTNPLLLEDDSPLALSYLEVQYLTRRCLEDLTDRFPLDRRRIRKAALWVALSRAVQRRIVKPSWHTDVRNVPSGAKAAQACHSQRALLDEASPGVRDLASRVDCVEEKLDEILDALRIPSPAKQVL